MLLLLAVATLIVTLLRRVATAAVALLRVLGLLTVAGVVVVWSRHGEIGT